jgi:hypothetical protein
MKMLSFIRLALVVLCFCAIEAAAQKFGITPLINFDNRTLNGKGDKPIEGGSYRESFSYGAELSLRQPFFVVMDLLLTTGATYEKYGYHYLEAKYDLDFVQVPLRADIALGGLDELGYVSFLKLGMTVDLPVSSTQSGGMASPEHIDRMLWGSQFGFGYGLLLSKHFLVQGDFVMNPRWTKIKTDDGGAGRMLGFTVGAKATFFL